MRAALRHAAWKAALWLGWLTLVIPLCILGSWLDKALEGVYGKLHRWAYREKYIPRERLPAPELGERWRQ